MRFISFIKELESEDKYIKSFIAYVKRNKKFPISGDPDLLFMYLRDKLNDTQKRGYILCMLIYAQQPGNMLPKRFKDKNQLLESVNRIVMNEMISETENIIQELDAIDPGLKAKYALEHICFFAADVPTKDGDTYVFLWVDAHSGGVIVTGIETEFNDPILLNHLQLFINHPDFTRRYKNRPITFFFHKYKHLLKKINEILKEIGGTSKVSDPYVSKIVGPVLQHLFMSLAENAGK